MLSFNRESKIFILILLPLLIYASSLGNGFIWDDDSYILNNPYLQNLEGLKNIWFSHKIHQYYPLVFSFFWIQEKFWGLNPLGYHLLSLVFHIANTLLCFEFFRRLFPKFAFLGALIFSCHPLQVETVCWVMEQKNIFSLFFFFCAALSFMRYDDENKTGWYALSFFCFTLALLCKTAVVHFILFPIFVTLRKGERPTRRDAKRIGPFLIMGLVAALHTVYLERFRVGAYGPEWDFSIAQRLLLSCQILFFYSSRFLFPFGEFLFFYPHWNLDLTNLWSYAFPLALAAILFVLFRLFQNNKREPLLSFLMMTAALFPVLGFFNFYGMKFSFVADHFTYPAMPYLIFFFLTFFFYFWESLRKRYLFLRNFHRSIGSFFLSLMMITFLSVKSFHLTNRYKDEETLWESLLAKNTTIALPFVNLGYLYIEKGRPQDAVQILHQGLGRFPQNAPIHLNLGIAYNNAGKPHLALKTLKTAKALDPDDPFIPNSIGKSYYLLQDLDKAIAYFKEAAKIDPDFPTAYYNLALAYYKKQNYQKAWKNCKMSLRLGHKAHPEFLRRLKNHVNQKKEGGPDA